MGDWPKGVAGEKAKGARKTEMGKKKRNCRWRHRKGPTSGIKIRSLGSNLELNLIFSPFALRRQGSDQTSLY